MNTVNPVDTTALPDASSPDDAEPTSFPESAVPGAPGPEELRLFEATLVAERTALLERARRSLAEDTRVDESELFDEIDQASAEYVQALTLRMRDREGWYLRKIELALERIRDGSFGICAECGDPIPIRRLRARPVAMLCAGCKEQQEVIERGYVG